ncbi:MAG: hypothetical protein H7Y86_03410 [Rhizobacter sp.]|nr:hypothetical protein [Ferruginibacter sp.]
MREIKNFQDFTETLGQENIDLITQDFKDGFADSIKLINYGNQLGVPVDYEMRTKCSLAHDHIKAKLRERFKDTNNSIVEMNKWNGVFALKFGDNYLCRIKKFLKGGEVSAILTNQQQKFNGQQIITGFPDRPTFITIGYYANLAWTEIVGVYAACWSANGLEWFNKLGGEGFLQLSIQFPQTTLPKTGSSRVKAKPGKRKDQGKTGTDNI